MLARELKISEPPLLRHGAKMNRKNVTWKGVSDHAGIIIERPVLAGPRPMDPWSNFPESCPSGDLMTGLLARSNRRASNPVCHTSVCSAISNASSTSMPR
jgi:hypothetical protein